MDSKIMEALYLIASVKNYFCVNVSLNYFLLLIVALTENNAIFRTRKLSYRKEKLNLFRKCNVKCMDTKFM